MEWIWVGVFMIFLVDIYVLDMYFKIWKNHGNPLET